MSDPTNELSQRLGLQLDHASDVPLHRQLSDQILQEILEGDLESGERLPTVRQLAIELSVHPQSVERAYSELELRGVVDTRAEGSFVTIRQPDDGALERSRRLEQLSAEVVSRAQSLGISLDDIIESIAEARAAQRQSRGRSE